MRMLFLALLIATNAHAALDARDSSFGTDTVIYDTNTDREWLRLDLTTAYTYDQLAAGALDGWSIAHEQDMIALFRGNGLTTDQESVPGNTSMTASFIDLFRGNAGWTFRPAFNVLNYAGVQTNGYFFTNSLGRLDQMNTTYLFRPAAPVPEPSTFLLLGAGLLALAYRRFAK